MVDASVVGLTDEPFEMVLERGKIREFARATMSSHPAYLSDPAPVVPPTFLTTTSFWMPPGQSVFAKIRLDLRRVLHGGQEYVFHGPPPRAGTVLRAQTRVADVFEKEGRRGGTMTFVVTVTEFRDPHGRLVAEARSTVIETGRAPDAGSGAPAGEEG
jgi:hypothetical protein